MLRPARRLQLEPCEDRSLPSALVPTTRPPAETAHTSTAAGTESTDDEATEYTNSAKPATQPGTGRANLAAEIARALVPDYVVAAYPAIPPMPMGSTAPATPAVTSPAPAGAPTPAPVVAAISPAPAPAVQPPPPAPAIPEQAAVVPADDRPDDGPVESPGYPSGTGDQPAILDAEFPPVGPVVAGLVIGDLDLRVHLAGWTATAGRLLDGLDAVVDTFDAESPWVRLGYWALAIGTVGVTVELTRQGLRTKPPDPLRGPSLPVTR
jgi:hypothetical protein